MGLLTSTQVVVPSSLHPPADQAEAITPNECGQVSPPPEGDRSAYRPTRFAEGDPKTTPVRQVSLTFAPRDNPKITAKANDTLKWTVHPPRRRFDLLPVANFPRSGRSRFAFRRHTNNSSYRTRGQRPQAIELLRLTVRFEPKFAPSRVLERVLRLTVGFEPKFAPSDGVERVARMPTTSRKRWPWAGLSKDPVPRRGFPHPLRSAFAVFHDLGGLLLSEPSDVFQSVTLVEFSTGEAVPDGGPSRSDDPKTSSSRESPHGSPLVPGPRIAEATLSPTRS